MPKKQAATATGHGKSMAKPAPAPPKRDHPAELRYRAERWAELHANPKKRAEMDALLEGLSEADQRHVYLNGMRLRGGLTYKYHIAPTVTRKETHEENTTTARGRQRRATDTAGGSAKTPKVRPSNGVDAAH